MKNEANQGLKIRNKLVHPWWLTTVSLSGMGQPWKIITLSSIQWISIEQKTYFGCEKTTKKGWRHHATSPFLFYNISNSKPILSQKSQPPQGSQSVETWRTWRTAGKLNTIHPSGCHPSRRVNVWYPVSSWTLNCSWTPTMSTGWATKGPWSPRNFLPSTMRTSKSPCWWEKWPWMPMSMSDCKKKEN